jgi:hypothetical protein
MLFVFQVDTGRMMTFDMSLALERSVLKHSIRSREHRLCLHPSEGILAESQPHKLSLELVQTKSPESVIYTLFFD